MLALILAFATGGLAGGFLALLLAAHFAAKPRPKTTVLADRGGLGIAWVHHDPWVAQEWELVRQWMIYLGDSEAGAGQNIQDAILIGWTPAALACALTARLRKEPDAAETQA